MGKEHDTKLSVDLQDRQLKKDFKERAYQYDTTPSELVRAWAKTYLVEHPIKGRNSEMIR
jgi:hypothetical protein